MKLLVEADALSICERMLTNDEAASRLEAASLMK